MYQIHFVKDNEQHFIWCVNKSTADILKKELNGIIVKDKTPSPEIIESQSLRLEAKKARRLLSLSENTINKEHVPLNHYGEMMKSRQT